MRTGRKLVRASCRADNSGWQTLECFSFRTYLFLPAVFHQTTSINFLRFLGDVYTRANSSHSRYSDSQGALFGFVGIRIQCFHFSSGFNSFWIDDETGKFWFRIDVLCVHDKANPGRPKRFGFVTNPETLICSSVNVVLGRRVKRLWLLCNCKMAKCHSLV